MRIRIRKSEGRRVGGDLVGPKDTARWCAWRRARDKRIAGKPAKKTGGK